MAKANNKIVHYYVEGECEEKLIRTLIDKFHLLPPGRVKVLNIKQKKIPTSRLINIKPGSFVVFVFDTDVDEYEFLIENKKALDNQKQKIRTLLLPQVRNLEDELKRSCKITSIRELTNSRSNKDFKRDFIKASNLEALLEQAHFEFASLWTQPLPVKLKALYNGKNELCS